MDHPPQNTPTANEGLKAFISSPAVYGAAALCLLGAASFMFVFTFLSTRPPGVPQASAASTASAAAAFDGISLMAKSAYVLDLRTGQTLYELNPDAQLPLASITKVALALVVSEVLPRNSFITIPYDTAPRGSAERLGRGEKWRVRDVVNFTLVASSNHGADILAAAANNAIHERYPLSPQKDATLWRMNDLAHDLGLGHTYFLNHSGLDISATQSGAYSSARDVALLMGYAATSAPEVFAATTENGMLLTDERGNSTSAFNTNEALGDISGLIMGKTGFTDLAGGNLAVVFDDGLAHPIAVVVMGSTREGRFEDVKKLVETARIAAARQ